MEKYKKKLQEAADMRQQVKVVLNHYALFSAVDFF